jgi:GH25 family lysozyme M1 (1,4-beta-N-acetylmuramidase)
MTKVWKNIIQKMVSGGINQVIYKNTTGEYAVDERAIEFDSNDFEASITASEYR